MKIIKKLRKFLALTAPDNLELPEVSFVPSYPATKWVLLAGRKYKNYFYHCNIYVSSQNLIHWLSSHALKDYSYNNTDLKTRNLLLNWLNKADHECDAVTILDPHMVIFFKNEIGKFLEQGKLQIFCKECKEIYQNAKITSKNPGGHSGPNFWVDEWKCINDHLLYRQERFAHIYTGKNLKATNNI